MADIILSFFLTEIIECWLKSKIYSKNIGSEVSPSLTNTLLIISGKWMSLWRSTRKLTQKWTLLGTLLDFIPDILIPIVEYTIYIFSRNLAYCFCHYRATETKSFFLPRSIPLSFFCRQASWNLAWFGRLRTRSRSKSRTSLMDPCWKSAPLAKVYAFSIAAEIPWYYLTSQTNHMEKNPLRRAQVEICSFATPYGRMRIVDLFFLCGSWEQSL